MTPERGYLICPLLAALAGEGKKAQSCGTNKSGAEPRAIFFKFPNAQPSLRGGDTKHRLAFFGGLAGVVGATLHRQHDHLGADADARVEIGDVLVGEADATG